MPKHFSKDRILTEDSPKFHISNEGFLVFEKAIIARSGIQEYFAYEFGDTFEDRNPMDRIKVYRPEEEVFKKESMDTFANSVVTNDHPPEFVNPENVKKYQVGYTGDNITREGNFMVAKLIITDEHTINDIKNGKREISNGYTNALDFTPGITPTGEHYDAIQSDIVGNHISIVEKARCGPSCNVNDSKPKKVNKMPKITIDSIDYDVDNEQLGQAISKLQASRDSEKSRADEAEKKAKEAEDEKEEAMKKAEDEKEEAVSKATDSLQAKIDQLEANQINPESLDALIESRSAIIKVAAASIDGFSPKGKDCEQIKREVVMAHAKDSKALESKSTEYFNARFDLIAESTDSSSDLANAFRKHAQSNDGVQVTDSEKAREERNKRNKEAWKPQA